MDLLDMQAVETAPLIERAYASDHVDEMFCGHWDEVQYELGLKERPTPKPDYRALPGLPTPAELTPSTTNTPAHKTTKKSPPSNKTKIKMADLEEGESQEEIVPGPSLHRLSVEWFRIFKVKIESPCL